MSVRSFTLCTSSMCVLAYPVLAEFDGKAKVSKYSNLKDLMRVDISFHPLCSVFFLTSVWPNQGPATGCGAPLPVCRWGGAGGAEGVWCAQGCNEKLEGVAGGSK